MVCLKTFLTIQRNHHFEFYNVHFIKLISSFCISGNFRDLGQKKVLKFLLSNRIFVVVVVYINIEKGYFFHYNFTAQIFCSYIVFKLSDFWTETQMYNICCFCIIWLIFLIYLYLAVNENTMLQETRSEKCSFGNHSSKLKVDIRSDYEIKITRVYGVRIKLNTV